MSSDTTNATWLAGSPPATSTETTNSTWQSWGASQAGSWGLPSPTGWGLSTHHELCSDFGLVESDHLEHLKTPGWSRVQPNERAQERGSGLPTFNAKQVAERKEVINTKVEENLRELEDAEDEMAQLQSQYKEARQRKQRLEEKRSRLQETAQRLMDLATLAHTQTLHKFAVLFRLLHPSTMMDYHECEAEMEEVTKILIGTSEEFPNLSWKKMQEQWSMGWEESKESDGWKKREGNVTDWAAKSHNKAWGGPAMDINKEIDERLRCTKVLNNI
ncbi:hypothetical protein BT96DRAFT_945697 [Gymnopus androsaceus JB14]|uniref:Uncharacterized protein n=1 Tax=Gymnopus androsaceus JB14 TaxID=1447944 RepID=A0A6A4GZU7_9AGAR|nr:hypothetical protein BT96DRAFT_945697 [Gymnopus androsaceus JB14]